jgi:hypothetical protein
MGTCKEISEDRRADQNHDDHAGAVRRPQQRPVKRGDCDLSFRNRQDERTGLAFNHFGSLL